MEFNKKLFSDDLRTERLINRRIGLREVSQEVNICIGNLSKYENQTITPSVKYFFILCDWMDKPLKRYKIY
ncbi:MAG: hypothetical protein GF317_23335 [Candidatus Lokiarchaeota archaeon]|nr:hypothetical protein [Candidatus Lokiarchaeota archaeon]